MTSVNIGETYTPAPMKEIERFSIMPGLAFQEGVGEDVLLEYSGLLLPYNVDTGRPGITFINGRIVEFAGTIFKPGFLKEQLARSDPLARVRHTWQHASLRDGGADAMPVGDVLNMTQDEQGVHVQVNVVNTGLGEELAEHIRAGRIKELSAGVREVTKVKFETIGDDVFRIALAGEIWEVSPVLWGQIKGARITEVNESPEADAEGENNARVFDDRDARIRTNELERSIHS